MDRHAPQRGAARTGSLALTEGEAVIDLYQAAAFALSDTIVDPAVPFQVLGRGGIAPPPGDRKSDTKGGRTESRDRKRGRTEPR